MYVRNRVFGISVNLISPEKTLKKGERTERGEAKTSTSLDFFSQSISFFHQKDPSSSPSFLRSLKVTVMS